MENIESLKKHIKELEQHLLEPETRTSLDELNKFLADDFFEIGSTGKVWYKKDISTEGLSVKEFILSNFDIHPLAEGVVLATYRIEDKTLKVNSLRSSIWKLIDGRWQMIFHQGTIEK